VPAFLGKKSVIGSSGAYLRAILSPNYGNRCTYATRAVTHKLLQNKKTAVAQRTMNDLHLPHRDPPPHVELSRKSTNE
jgi:hypothetical protein